MVQYSHYKIGPEIARLFYTLNKPQDALELLKNQEINVLFNNFQTNFILANLLYDREMYQDVIEIFYFVIEKQYHGKKYYPSITNLFFAANYKLVNFYIIFLRIIVNLNQIFNENLNLK